MELRQLEHFVAVAEEGSFTAAAARLYLAQSSLSSSLHALERELGVDLFARHRRGIELTDAGRALLKPARTTLRGADQARDAAAQVAGVIRGTVRIAAPIAIPPSADVVETIRQFTCQHPGVEIHVITSDARSMTDMVVDRQVDFAISPRSDLKNSALRFRPLISTSLALFCAADHRLAGARDVDPAELAGEFIIDLPRCWQSRVMFDDLLARHSIERDVRLEVSDWLSSVMLAQRGLGVTYGPEVSLHNDLFSGVAVATLSEAPSCEFGVVTRDDSLRGAAGRAFLAAYLEQRTVSTTHGRRRIPADSTETRRAGTAPRETLRRRAKQR